MQRLSDAGILEQGHIKEEILNKTATEVTELFRKARQMRREAKKVRGV
jgi:hypothetical protein